MQNRPISTIISSDLAELQTRHLQKLILALKKLPEENDYSSHRQQEEFLLVIIEQLEQTLKTYRTKIAGFAKISSHKEQAAHYGDAQLYFLESWEKFLSSLKKFEDYIFPYLSEIDKAIENGLKYPIDSNFINYLEQMRKPLSELLVHEKQVYFPTSDYKNKSQSQMLKTARHALKDCENQLREFRYHIIEKVVFCFSDNPANPGQQYYPGIFKTVHDFTKENCDFILAGFNGEKSFQTWCMYNAGIMTPLSMGLNEHINTPITEILFKNALSECLLSGKKNSRALITYMESCPCVVSDNEDIGLLPFMEDMIHSGELGSIVKKWRKDKIKDYHLTFEMIQLAKADAEHLDHLIDLHGDFYQHPDLKIIAESFKKHENHFAQMDTLWSLMDKINPENLGNNDMLLLENIYSFCLTHRKEFKEIQSYLFADIDGCFFNHIEKHKSKLGLALREAKEHLEQSLLNLGDKLKLTDFLSYFENHLTPLAIRSISDTENNRYKYLLSDLLQHVKTKSTFIQNIETLIEDELSKVREVLHKNKHPLFGSHHKTGKPAEEVSAKKSFGMNG